MNTLKCPRCNSEFDFSKKEFSLCPKCNYIFPENIIEKISMLFFFRDRINSINHLKASFDNELNQFNEKKIQVETALSMEIKELSAKIDKTPYTEKEAVIIKHEPEKIQEKPKQEIKVKKPLNLEAIFGFNTFLILGVISVILGIGFFIRKAFVSGLLGPIGKVTIIYLIALLSLGIGNYFRKKPLREFGLGIIGMGIAILYFSTYAAFEMYNIFDQPLSFSVMILITVFTVFMAIIENNIWLAVLGLIGGFATPIVLDSGSGQTIALFTYITIINAGILGIALYKRWNLLNNLGFICTYMIYLEAYKVSEFFVSIIFLNIFFFIYSLVPFSYNIFKSEKENVGNYILIFLNSFIALGLNYYILDYNNYKIEYLSIIALMYALNFILMASYLQKKGKQKEQVFTFVIGKASLFLIIAVPLLFSKQLITMLWFAEALILIWMSNKLESKKMITGACLLLLTGLIKLFFYDYPFVFGLNDSVILTKGFSFLVIERYITVTFMLVSFYLFNSIMLKFQEPFKSLNKNIAYIFMFIWIFSLFAVLNYETSSFFYEKFNEIRFVMISILWAIFAISLMFVGFKKNNEHFRKLSIIIFITTLLKVFLFDISQLNASYKFISFIVLGLILILTSYLYRKYKEELIENISETKESKQNENI